MLRLGRLVLTPEEGGPDRRWQHLVTSPALFSPLSLRGLTLPNRLVVAPMCQYSVIDGFVGDYHLVHLGRFALGGFGLVLVEATAVTADGRISHGDVGLWSDAHVPGLARVVDFLHDHGARAGVQLAHAGGKASSLRPWEGTGPVTPESARPGEQPWPTVSASAVPVGPGWPEPHALTVAEMAGIRDTFVGPVQGVPEPARGPRTGSFDCSTSSSRRSPSGARTATAARRRPGCASRSRWSRRSGWSGRRTGRCSCGSPRSTARATG